MPWKNTAFTTVTHRTWGCLLIWGWNFNSFKTHRSGCWPQQAHYFYLAQLYYFYLAQLHLLLLGFWVEAWPFKALHSLGLRYLVVCFHPYTMIVPHALKSIREALLELQSKVGWGNFIVWNPSSHYGSHGSRILALLQQCGKEWYGHSSYSYHISTSPVYHQICLYIQLLH